MSRVLIGRLEIEASALKELLEILYVLVLDYQRSGGNKADSEFAAKLKELAPAVRKWTKALPALSQTVASSISGSTAKVPNLVGLGQEIREKFTTFRADEEFTGAELDVLKACGLYLRNDSPSALAKLQKMASMGGPWVAQRFLPDAQSQEQVAPTLKSVVKQLSGRDAPFLTVDEAKIARTTKPELYKEYLRLSREFNQSWKDAAVTYVRMSGSKLVPYPELLAHLDSLGLTYRLPIGFTGLVDDQLRMYTQKKELIDGVPSAITSPTLQMNPRRSAQAPWIFKAIKADGSAPTYFYTSQFKAAQAEKKFALVKGLADRMPAIRRKWVSSIRNFDPNDRNHVAHAVLETLYQTSGRIGSRGNSTFGIGTLQVRHLLPQSNGDLRISYVGKDSVRNKHLLRKADADQRRLIDALLALADGKEPKDLLFTAGRTAVPPTYVNKMFKALSGVPDATVHKIRTFRGTQLFDKLMYERLPVIAPKISSLQQKSVVAAEKLAMAEFTKIAEAVGKLLNHVRRGAEGEKVVGTTAIQNYIDTASLVRYFRELEMRPPRMLERVLRTEQ